jgi:hypothetical protein
MNAAQSIDMETERNKYPLSFPVAMFDTASMAEHGRALGVSGRLLNKSHETALAVSVLAQIVRASMLNAEAERPQLKPHEEDGIMAAIILLTEELGEDLCTGADKVLKHLNQHMEGE